MSAATGIAPATEPNPYPGLRPFEADESDIFFGREAHTGELLQRLAHSRFLAVVGTSGSGKSSLVRAGLLPALHGGYLASAGSHWSVVLFRPGGDPIASLAEALRDSLPPPNTPDPDFYLSMVQTTLRRSSLGLLHVIRQANLPSEENVLLVVDQFEELFRYRQASELDGESPAAFTGLLLAAVEQNELPVHVMITMRSDFLGDCARFRGLAEAVNNGLYLIPRLTRDQMRLAIEAPAATLEAKMDPGLVQQLLNDVHDDPDQLPVLQHALMRTWNVWEERRGPDETPDPDGEPDPDANIGLEDFKAAGGMAHALSNHANEVLTELNEQEKGLAKILFQCLTERGADNREVRRPTRLKDIAAIAGAGVAEVGRVIDRFRQPGRAFLMPKYDVPLTPEQIIDISHESLIRKWEPLREWVREEGDSQEMYRRMAESARRWGEGKEGLWRDPELGLALAWKARCNPTAVWARTSVEEFDEALRFLARSHEEDQIIQARAQQAGRSRRRRLIGGIAVSVLALVAFLLFWWERTRSVEARARQLAADSALELNQNPQLGTSILLAIESLKSHPTPEADYVLRSGLARMPAPAVIKAYKSPVTAVAASGRFFAAGTDDGRVVVYETSSHTQVATVQHARKVKLISFSPDSRFLASGGEDGKIQIIPVPGGAPVASFEFKDQVSDLAFSPNGRKLAVGCADQKLYLLDLDSHDIQFQMNFLDTVSAVRFSPDGKWLAAGSFDGTLAILEPATTQILWTLSPENESVQKGSPFMVTSLAFFPDSKRLAVTSLKGVTILEVGTRKKLWHVPHSNGAFVVAMDPASEYLAAAFGDASVRILDRDHGYEVDRVVHQQSVFGLAFSPDGRYLASASGDSTTRVRDLVDNLQVATVSHEKDVNSVVFSPDGKVLLTGSDDGTMRVTPARFRDLNRAPETDPNLKELSKLAKTVQRISPDQRYSATLAQEDNGDRVIRLKEVSSGKVTTFKESVAGEFSPDGRYFAYGGYNQKAVLLNPRNWEQNGEFMVRGWVMSLSFSPDSRFLAVGTDAGTARVFELSSGRETARIPHATPVDLALMFSPDGRYLYTISSKAEKTIYRHLLRHEELIAEACSRVGRSLNATEWSTHFGKGEPQQTCPAVTAP